MNRGPATTSQGLDCTWLFRELLCPVVNNVLGNSRINVLPRCNAIGHIANDEAVVSIHDSPHLADCLLCSQIRVDVPERLLHFRPVAKRFDCIGNDVVVLPW